MARSARNRKDHREDRPIHGLEVEFKFELGADDLRVLTRAPAFKALFVEASPRRQTLRATYFDTPDLKLSARGVSLRVRKESRRHVQCVKAGAGAGGDASTAGGFARREWQWPVVGAHFDAALLKTDAALKALFKGVAAKKLQPIFSTEIQRLSRELVTPGGARVRCDIDRGRILSQGREVPIHEMELELQSGPVDELFALADTVTAIVPARLSARTKAHRGFTLFLDQGQPWSRAAPVVLGKAPRAEDVLVAAMSQGLQHLIANEDCVLTRSHSEGVHQMRVAMRRMRSLITTFKKHLPTGAYEDLAAALEAAATQLGPARDWDVFVDELLPPVQAGLVGVDDGALAALRKRAENRRREGYRRADRLIASPEYARLLSDVLVWIGAAPWRGGEGDGALDKPARTVAAQVLARRHAHLLKAGKGLKDQSAEQRHRLRIAVKKARYAAEFCQPVYTPKKAPPYIQALRALQDELGHLNDLATARRMMDDLITSTRGDKTQILAHAAGLVEGWYANAQAERESELRKAWKTLAKAKVFW